MIQPRIVVWQKKKKGQRDHVESCMQLVVLRLNIKNRRVVPNLTTMVRLESGLGRIWAGSIVKGKALAPLAIDL